MKKTLSYRRLIRLYATLSQVNQAILKASSPDSFMEEICQIAVHFGKFKFVWIGLVDKDSKRVLPVAHAGDSNGYLNSISISVDPDRQDSHGPTGRAILTGKSQVVQDFEHDKRTVLWQKEAKKRGFRSSMAVPISRHGERIGALMLYAGEKRFFESPEKKLIAEIAKDISFALTHMDSEARRKAAEREIHENQRRLSILLETSLTVNRIFDTPSLMKQLILMGIELTDATKGGYSLRRESKIVCETFFDGEDWIPYRAEFAIGDGVHGWVWNHRAPYVTNDPGNDPVLSERERSMIKPRNLIIVPILSATGDFLGAIKLIDKKIHESFGPPEIKILESLAAQAAVALENAYLVKDISRSESDLRLYKRAIESSILALTIADARMPDFPLIYVNPRFCALTGYAAEEVLGRNCRFLQGDDRDQEGLAGLRRALENGDTFETVLKNYRKDGTPFMNRISIFPVHDKEGRVTHVVGIQNDISETLDLQKGKDLSARVFEMASDGIMITDRDNRIVQVNRAFSELTGYPSDEILHKDPKILASGRHNASFYQSMWQDIQMLDHWQGEIWNRRKTGEIFPEWLSVSVIRNTDGNVENFIGIFHDLTGLKASEERIAFLAYHDPLTGLPNRVLLRDRLEHALTQARRNQKELGIVLIDLDGFKDINDLMGHHAGDRLLVEMAARMTSTVRASDTVCRLGGDEFLLVLPDLADVAELSRLVERIFSEIREPVEIGGKSISVTASGGITLYPIDSSDIDDLMRHADIAMYNAKNGGRNRVRYYERDMEGELRKKEQLRTDIRNAMLENQFFLVYQPQVNLLTGEVFGVEALIRWRTADGTIRYPGEFLPAIEEEEISVEIGRWVLREAFLQAKDWKNHGIILRVGVNVSPRHFVSGSLENDLRNLTGEIGIVEGMIELDITENTMIRDIREAQRIVRACRHYGMRFALDDFGTGFTSLTTIKTLLPDTLKVDQTFLREMSVGKTNRAILESIMMIGKSFRETVVQEGIETPDEARVLLEMGCHFGQGYLIAKPMNVSDIPGFLQVWKQEKRWTEF